MRVKSKNLPSNPSLILRIVEPDMPIRTGFAPFMTMAAALATLPQGAAAQQWGLIVSGITGCDFVTGKISAACIPRFVGHLITFVYGFVGIFFILNVMYAGYELALAYIAEGDKGSGKDRLKWSIIGLIITTCSYLILDLVLSVILG